jgi:hypothetical protein
VLAAFCLTKSLLCNVAKFLSGLLSHASGHPSVSRRFEQFKVAFIRMSWQHIRTHIRVRKIIRFPSHTHIWERQLHPFERQGNTVRTRSLIRQDVEKNCNRPNAVLIMKIACSRVATIRMLGQHLPDAALIWRV